MISNQFEIEFGLRNLGETNLELIECVYDELGFPFRELLQRYYISFVDNWLGHDWRCAIDASKMLRELRWAPAHDVFDGIPKTIYWYAEDLAFDR